MMIENIFQWKNCRFCVLVAKKRCLEKVMNLCQYIYKWVKYGGKGQNSTFLSHITQNRLTCQTMLKQWSILGKPLCIPMDVFSNMLIVNTFHVIFAMSYHNKTTNMTDSPLLCPECLSV
jgi:hypothetical protein